MNRSITNIVTLCEGVEDAAFIRYFLRIIGWLPPGKKVRELICGGQRDGKQHVRESYPRELIAARTRYKHASYLLVVMTDADTLTVIQRRATLDAECVKHSVESKLTDEPVAVFIPRRNLETWVRYLDGQAVVETEDYAKLDMPSALKPFAEKLHQICRASQSALGAPESLELACAEYSRIRKVIG